MNEEKLKQLKNYQKKIRNFSIVAHIDHGKSTIADRILEKTHTVSEREMKDQLLDTMELEKERGITIKMNSVEVVYHSKNGEDYFFHMIDTPGHVDFSYEVSRSLNAADGALLVVDATQGVQAQTLSNAYLAIENDLEILPVINKIDLPSAMVSEVEDEIEDTLGIDTSEDALVSAKTGKGIDELLEKIVNELPAPNGDLEAPLKALIFDSAYDSYKGVVVNIRVKEGMVKPGDKITFMNSNSDYIVNEVGIFSPEAKKKDLLIAGDVGYLTASIKNIKDAKSGDTITLTDNKAEKPLDGYQKINSMVFAGLFPIDSKKYESLREALEKLQLNDASLEFQTETSKALGFGFRVGFLGLLHMDIIQERLEREFGIDIITTAPSVIYKVIKKNKEELLVHNPSDFPDLSEVDKTLEPFVKAEIIVPEEFVGNIMELVQSKRGVFKDMKYLNNSRSLLNYELPLSEIIFDFFNKLKSSSKGYASLDYELIGYRESKLKKVDILLNGEKVDALSFITFQDNSNNRSRLLIEKLKEVIPRQNFEIPIQAVISTKVIARTNIKSYRKDVTAKLYGGDKTRRMKLLEKQKAGKNRMKAVGSVEIPQEAFMAILNTEE